MQMFLNFNSMYFLSCIFLNSAIDMLKQLFIPLGTYCCSLETFKILNSIQALSEEA